MNLDLEQIFFLNMHSITIYISPLVKFILKKIITMDFSIKNIKAFYLLSLIEAVNPSFIFSAVDNNKNYWRLKNYFPEKKVFLFQNGLRGVGDLKTKENFYLKGESLRVDHIFVMTKNEKQWYVKNNLKATNVHVCGSIKNNEIELNSKVQDCTLVYLLQYKHHDYLNSDQQLSRYVKSSGELLSYEDI